MTDQLTVTERIIQALDELIEIHGTEHLTYEVIGASCKSFVICKLRNLETNGEIIIQRGNGRGHKNVFRKNRNSPGCRSDRDKHGRQTA